MGLVTVHDTSPAIDESGLVSGHDFSRANKPQNKERALAPVGEADALKEHDLTHAESSAQHESGHDFSRADEAQKEDRALAPEALAALVSNASLRIIADHARAATFLINDGVLPANEGRGYVLRKILRRGIRHGRLLGQEQPFLFEMVYAVRDLMQGAYPELADSAARVAKVVEAEEKQFDRVLKTALTELNNAFYLSAPPIAWEYYLCKGFNGRSPCRTKRCQGDQGVCRAPRGEP